jgi:hypothetical protein
MSFLLSAATIALTEHCDNFSDQLREIIRQLEINTKDPENLPFKAVKRVILEWADEIDAEWENSSHANRSWDLDSADLSEAINNLAPFIQQRTELPLLKCQMLAMEILKNGQEFGVVSAARAIPLLNEAS